MEKMVWEAFLGALTTAGAAVLKGSSPASIFTSFMSAVQIELETFQRDLARIEKQLAEIQSDLKLLMEAPMKTALTQLEIASVTLDASRKERSLALAHDEFIRAASLVPQQILPNEIPKHLPVVRARVYAGACGDLMSEPGAL